MKERDVFLAHKIKLFKAILISLGIMVFLMSLVRLFEHHYTQFFADIFLVMILLVGYIKLKLNKQSFYVVFRVVLFSSFLAATSLLVVENEQPMRFIWFTTVVYIMFYVLGKREGWVWTAVVFVLLAAIFIYDSTLLNLNKKDFFTWIFNMLIILIVANWYEKIKEDVIEKQKDIQELLEKEVATKTLELQEINTHLEERVKHEVEKNRQREQMMLHQTRLAQMGEMISMIAHQWRQPLAAISATTNALLLKNKRGAYENEMFEDKLQKIATYSQHMSTTIDDFRNFFKADKEKKETTVETVILEVLSIANSSLENKNVELVTDFKYNKNVFIYANELKQVLLNLIKNAEDILVENNVSDPQIILRSFEENGYSVLSVEDNGGGIDMEIIDKVFDPYFSTKLDKEGTGLGLYMSKIIVQEHCAGTLSVKNSSKGAVFRIEMKGKEVSFIENNK